jgi:hypothetical protein
MLKLGNTCPLNLDKYFKSLSDYLFNDIIYAKQRNFHIIAYSTKYLLPYIPETSHAYFLSLQNFTVKAIIKFAKRIKTIRIKNLKEI